MRTFYFSLLMLLFTCAGLQAQVVIGLKRAPVAGTLLELREQPTDDGSSANSTKGLLLPRVALTDVDQLFPMFEASPGSGAANPDYKGTKKTEEDWRHTGLLVYNIGTASLSCGVYIWTGTGWRCLTPPCS